MMNIVSKLPQLSEKFHNEFDNLSENRKIIIQKTTIFRTVSYYFFGYLFCQRFPNDITRTPTFLKAALP